MNPITRFASGSGYTPVTSFLLKAPKATQNHIIVGSCPAQIPFAEEVLGQPVLRVDRVTDDMLEGKSGLLLGVHEDHQIDLSEDVKGRTGIWSANELTRGSSGINAITKAAMAVLGIQAKELPKDYLQIVGDVLVRSRITNIRAALWCAVGTLSAPLQGYVRWEYPWENPRRWMPENVAPSLRLNSLYRDLCGFSYLRRGHKASARELGLSPSKIKFLEALNIPTDKALQTLTELSRWRTQRYDPWRCALSIATIWE